MEQFLISRAYKTYINRHSHANFHELLFVVDGSGSFVYNGQVHNISKNHLLLVPAGNLHGFYSTENTLNMFYLNVPNSLDCQEIIFNITTVETINMIKSTLQFLFLEKSAHHSNLNNLINTAYNLIYKAALNEQSKKSLSSPVEQLKMIIDKNACDTEFNILTAMKSFSYSNGYISRLFCKELGFPPIKYLNLVRIKSAQSYLIQYPYKTIGNIAYLSGFCDQQYFSRVFKKLTGHTPIQFKQAVNSVKPTNRN